MAEQAEQFKVVADVPVHVQMAFEAYVPERLAHAKISNFELSDDPIVKAKQKAVRNSLVAICQNIDEFCANCHQLFIWGRVGTGKDHFAIAVGREAMRRGYMVRWYDAATLYEAVTDYKKRERQMELLRRYDAIILSDAVCNREWSEKKQYALRKIVNDRWNRKQATWVTANVTDVYGTGPNTAETLFVRDTLDRLVDGAAIIHCDWPSYRKTRTWKPSV